MSEFSFRYEKSLHFCRPRMNERKTKWRRHWDNTSYWFKTAMFEKHTLSYDIYYLLNLSLVTCHLSPVTYQLSAVSSQLSAVSCQLSDFTCHLSPVTCNLSPVTLHLSPVTCHLSPVTWPQLNAASPALKVLGGLVIRCGRFSDRYSKKILSLTISFYSTLLNWLC